MSLIVEMITKSAKKAGINALMRRLPEDVEEKSSMTKGDSSAPGEERDFLKKEGEEELKVAN